jgi:hypothetical protein
MKTATYVPVIHFVRNRKEIGGEEATAMDRLYSAEWCLKIIYHQHPSLKDALDLMHAYILLDEGNKVDVQSDSDRHTNGAKYMLASD